MHKNYGDALTKIPQGSIISSGIGIKFVIMFLSNVSHQLMKLVLDCFFKERQTRDLVNLASLSERCVGC